MPRYANVVSTLALFAALGGTATAAVTLERDSVGAAADPHRRRGAAPEIQRRRASSCATSRADARTVLESKAARRRGHAEQAARRSALGNDLDGLSGGALAHAGPRELAGAGAPGGALAGRHRRATIATAAGSSPPSAAPGPRRDRLRSGWATPSRSSTPRPCSRCPASWTDVPEGNPAVSIRCTARRLRGGRASATSSSRRSRSARSPAPEARPVGSGGDGEGDAPAGRPPPDPDQQPRQGAVPRRRRSRSCDLAEYYAAVEPAMRTHVDERPLNVWRWNAGIDKGVVVQQEIPKGVPEWVRRVAVPRRGKGGTVDPRRRRRAGVRRARAVQLRDAARLDRARRRRRQAGPARLRPRPARRGRRRALRRHPQGRARARRSAARAGAAAVRDDVGLARPARRRAAAPPARLRHGARTRRASSPSCSSSATRTGSRPRGARRSAAGACSSTWPATPTARRPSPPTRCARCPARRSATPLAWEELDDAALHPRRWTLATCRTALADARRPWAGIAGRRARCRASRPR